MKRLGIQFQVFPFNWGFSAGIKDHGRAGYEAGVEFGPFVLSIFW